jgi:hypothetical protein
MTWTTVEGHEIKSLRTMITHDKLKVKKARRDQGHHQAKGSYSTADVPTSLTIDGRRSTATPTSTRTTKIFTQRAMTWTGIALLPPPTQARHNNMHAHARYNTPPTYARATTNEELHHGAPRKSSAFAWREDDVNLDPRARQ